MEPIDENEEHVINETSVEIYRPTIFNNLLLEWNLSHK